MRFRILGKSNLEVSEIGIGCWAIGGPDWNINMEMGWSETDDKSSLAGLRRAFDLGANHFDTADVYGHGHSERLIGEFLKNIPRDKVIISSKFGYFRGTAPNAYHPLQMKHQLEMSLSNLGSDYLDIYYFHNFNFGENDEYLYTAIETMYRFKEEGKILVIGQRGPHTYAPNRILGIKTGNKYQRFLHIAGLVQPEVIQIRYNMISPFFDNPETDIFAWAEVNNVGLVINKPLGQGLLLDKYDPDNPPVFGSGDHRNRKRWFESEGLRVLRKRLSYLKIHFGYELADLARVAIQYCLARSKNGCVVVGFKNPEQIEMNLTAAGKYLSDEEVQFIREAMAGVNEEIGDFFAEE